MKRAGTGILVLLLCFGALAFRPDAAKSLAQNIARHEQATGRETLRMTPGRGSIDTDFTVAGSGFRPGSLVDESFADSNGTEWQFSNWSNFNVKNDGSFGYTYNFGNTAQAASLPSGRWTASYCYDGTDSCWVVDFVIQ